MASSRWRCWRRSKAATGPLGSGAAVAFGSGTATAAGACSTTAAGVCTAAAFGACSTTAAAAAADTGARPLSIAPRADRTTVAPRPGLNVIARRLAVSGGPSGEI